MVGGGLVDGAGEAGGGSDLGVTAGVGGLVGCRPGGYDGDAGVRVARGDGRARLKLQPASVVQ